MAKITAYVPEPTQNYDVNNQRQILEAINTIKDQLNFGYQQDLVNQQNAMTQFIYGTQSGSFCPQQPIEIAGGGGSTAYDAFGRLEYLNLLHYLIHKIDMQQMINLVHLLQDQDLQLHLLQMNLQ
jgi:hypothetical protein